jgi:Prokaryotic Cytochrome C oxidase subunit IV
MTELTDVLRTRATIVWLILSGLTITSWVLGTTSGDGTHVSASVVILLVTVFKVRLVGLYFMELREAPTSLRGVFEGYCAVLWILLTGMLIWG